MLKKLIILFVAFVLFILSEIKSQTSLDGFYMNESSGEFACLKNDTLSLRLIKKGAFNTCVLFHGLYNFSGDKIKLRKNILKNKTATVTETIGNDTTVQIQVVQLDNTPMKFAQITFVTKEKKKKEVFKQTNENGYLILYKNDMKDLLNASDTVIVETTGFITEQRIEVKLGRSYCIKSNVSNKILFSILRKKISITYKAKPQRIEICSFNKQIVTLKRMRECEPSLDLLFK